MHIVIDAHLAVKEIDGVTRYLTGLLGELPKQDRSIQYTIIALPEHKSGLPNHIFEQSNVRRFELDLMGPSPRLHLMMGKLLKELKADLYHHPQFDLPRGINIPCVVTIHDLKYIYHPEFFARKSKLKSLYVKRSLLYSLRRARKIIAVSNSTLQDLMRFTSFEEDRARVIYHGINSSIKKTVPIFCKNYILFVGTRRPHKNIEGLLKAVAILKNERNMDIHLAISGKSYSDYKEPEALTKSLRLERNVRFLDFVPDEELTNLYEAAQIVALPSFYEGFGFPVLEAMSHGKPVIASNVTSLPEIVGDAGLLIDPYDPSDIADKIQMILSNKKLRESLAMKARERIKLFSWKKVANATLDVYKAASAEQLLTP